MSFMLHLSLLLRNIASTDGTVCETAKTFMVPGIIRGLPVQMQAANHSSVNFAAPDFVRHPAYAQALESQLTAELKVNGFATS